MYKLIQVVKFNNEYFEEGEVVEVETTNKGNIVGSILIHNNKRGCENHSTCDTYLFLDISEKFHQKFISVSNDNIISIKKINS